jgi:hypothetical protein
MQTMQTTWHPDGLVPGRECGECQLCCIVPAIDKPEIQKLSGSPCRHCIGGGCDVYETRPEVCRTYYCGWRRIDLFRDNWRPDKSGVFAELETGQPPPFQNVGISMILVGNPLKTVRRHDFIDFVAINVRNNVALFLGLPGPNGKQAARLPLNNREIIAAASRSRAELKELLEKILKRLQAHTYIPYEMENSGQDVST